MIKRSARFPFEADALNDRLSYKFYSSRRYNPFFLAVTGLGFMAIFLLTQFGVLGDPAPQLLYIGSITLLFAIAEVPVLRLAQQNRGISATLIGSLAAGLFAALLTLFWQGILPVTILIALATPVIVLRRGMAGRYLAILLFALTIMVGAILWVDANAPVERLQNNSPAAIASIVFLVATGLLLVTITNISQNRKFRSIQGLLLTSFIMIVTIPIIMTALLSAVGAYTNSQAQTFNTLHAIATLKEDQIENLLLDFQNDAEALVSDARFQASTAEVLTAASVDPLLHENFKRLARLRMVDVLGAEEEAYNEIMVLNPRGEVVISTMSDREGSIFQNQPFFRQGISQFYAGFADESLFGTDNLIVASPMPGSDGQGVSGVLVLRSNAAAIKRIMESTPGFSQAETYLVDTDFQPVTRTRGPARYVGSRAASEAIFNHAQAGQAIYENYAGQQVLGHYNWFQPMQLAVVAEVPLSFVVNSSLGALVGSSLLALFIIAIAIAAVVVSARTIVDPIKLLAQTTESLAAGKLSVRAMVNREDEIGALARAYNLMATQLQEMIGKLEQRVADRTRDLESQTLRLRVAAEIARDAASARDLNELLARASELIQQRFNFYHIGIFLLDNNRDYAILVASPTEAGKRMLADHYRLRVGEAGMVGRVSATGEPAIALESGTDVAFQQSPYLPQTRSQMALPLKVENNIIGVLDVQSDQPQAFSDDDSAIMQVMADQLATAIERARLLQEVERNLRELETAYGQFTRDNWRRVPAGTETGGLGYRFDNVRLERITELPEHATRPPGEDTTPRLGNELDAGEPERRVSIPIRLRGHTLGVISLKLKEGHDHSTIAVVEAAADRLASALESARLYEDARLRADREQSISRLTTAISGSTGYEQILQTTVREIGSILDDTEVSIQILTQLSGDRGNGHGDH